SIRSSSGTAVVHLSYDMDNVPPRPYDPDKPGTRWTRFVCISDTHSVIDFPVPDGDILIHAGDLTTVGRVPDLQKTIQWLSRLPHAAKIVIAGSHDLVLDMDWYDQYSWKVHGKSLEVCSGVNAVLSTESALASSSGSSTEVSSSSSFSSSIPKEWKLFGVPGTPESDPDPGLAFHYAKGTDAEETFARVLPDTEILITHGPPANILDTSEEGTHVGCEELWKRVKAIRPRLHVFGHVHEGRGALIHTWGEEGDDDAEDVQENRCGSSETIFVNASSTPAGALYYEALNDGHSPDVGGYNFQPIIVDLLD
ncbi:Metallo-dependent phosphatase-like protein, partial [Cantharellus anzutake]|uniref:Metallo-dependent phosphatase-like protein n=1 Tax=Cantharellus anzutake TaxID=1750568 RepID=UPI001904C9E2